MNVQAAALEILRGAGEPLHAKEIAEQIMAAGLWQSRGKTPDATVSARLFSDIKNNGDKSPFVKVGPQTFALRDSTEMPSGAEPVPAAVQEAPKPSPANAGFSFTDCAQRVLEEFGGKKPMHYKEITEKALQKGWLLHVPSYRRRWEEKLNWYKDNGILPHEEGEGENGTLIVTSESARGGISSQDIERVICTVILDES